MLSLILAFVSGFFFVPAMYSAVEDRVPYMRRRARFSEVFTVGIFLAVTVFTTAVGGWNYLREHPVTIIPDFPLGYLGVMVLGFLTMFFGSFLFNGVFRYQIKEIAKSAQLRLHYWMSRLLLRGTTVVIDVH